MQQLDIMAPSLKVLGHKREREEKLCVGCRVAKDFPGRKKKFLNYRLKLAHDDEENKKSEQRGDKYRL